MAPLVDDSASPWRACNGRLRHGLLDQGHVGRGQHSVAVHGNALTEEVVQVHAGFWQP
ncbi:hypothetical protein [Cupriavidus sp. IDO]|uniref:hypothetical protein n=1 Tax=Cupriavidus sp. IDO TaxID=1539142 RepID=UPI000A48D891|nr:hypothetical protein [Cupriavidus sp. IDO]